MLGEIDHLIFNVGPTCTLTRSTVAIVATLPENHSFKKLYNRDGTTAAANAERENKNQKDNAQDNQCIICYD